MIFFIKQVIYPILMQDLVKDLKNQIDIFIKVLIIFKRKNIKEIKRN